MALAYLGNRNWSELSREERFYCYVLYSRAAADPAQLARMLLEQVDPSCDAAGEWDIGVEVCFYRDYLWHGNRSVLDSEFSPKRTFDLCLFGSRDIIIIEAKVCQEFDAAQADAFEDDAKLVPKLLDRPGLRIWLFALASSTYLARASKTSKAMRPFAERRISWADVYAIYDDPLLAQADALFGSQNRLLVPRGV